MKPGVLVAAGISEKSARIYLAALALGTTSVQEIARKSGLKRPTVYVHLDELIAQGLVEKVTVNKKAYYRAADPRALEARLKDGLAVVQAAVPEFLALQARAPGRPRVTLLEGKEGIESVYRELKEAAAVRIWSNIEAARTPFHDINMDVAETFGRAQTNVREIIADTNGARRYARLVQKVAGPTYQVRTAGSDGLANDSIVYGNTVALFRLSEHNMFVVRIEDKQIADSMKALFDMAWKSAKVLR